ncbi:TasA family protein [Nesterenkonia alba]|uniref:TasA family protein n=1 Tax=Nesterenkonia alba TaxID=515814 RepID=UPI00040CA77D|nr:TasA family protein [Nesterenkonia alba]
MKTEKGANTSSQNASKAQTSKRRKKLAAASVAGVAGLSLIGGGTLAAWNDAERAQVDIEAGAFGLEIATSADEDGNLEWLSGTTPGSTATIDLSTFIEDSVGGSAWRPCDMVTTNVFLRASEETTYNGVIEAEAIAEQVNGQFNEDIAYYIGNEHIAINNDGAVGEVDVPADGEPIVLDAQFLLNNTDNESQDRSYEGLWTFNAELADRDYEGAPLLNEGGGVSVDWSAINLESTILTNQEYRDNGGGNFLVFEGQDEDGSIWAYDPIAGDVILGDPPHAESDLLEHLDHDDLEERGVLTVSEGIDYTSHIDQAACLGGADGPGEPEPGEPGAPTEEVIVEYESDSVIFNVGDQTGTASSLSIYIGDSASTVNIAGRIEPDEDLVLLPGSGYTIDADGVGHFEGTDMEAGVSTINFASADGVEITPDTHGSVGFDIVFTSGHGVWQSGSLSDTWRSPLFHFE